LCDKYTVFHPTTLEANTMNTYTTDVVKVLQTTVKLELSWTPSQ